MVEIAPVRLPASSSPAVVEIDDEQRVLDEEPAEALAADEAAGVDAVVFGACVEVFEASPGNCSALWGLSDVAAFMAPTDPAAVADPRDNGSVDVGTVNGSEAVPVELA